MDAILTAGDFASETLQRVPSAASPSSAEPHVQETEAHSQPVWHGGNREDVQTRDSAEKDVAPDSPEAPDIVAQADTKENGHSPTNKIEDDISIASGDIFNEHTSLEADFERRHEPWLVKHYKEKGTKYARVAALYTEGLETRVGALEKELLELQYEVGSRERPSKERQVMRSISISGNNVFCF